jgi:hypothetical protein
MYLQAREVLFTACKHKIKMDLGWKNEGVKKPAAG